MGGDSAMGRGMQQSRCGHLSCSAWGAQGERTKVSLFVCALSSEGEGKPPAQADSGTRVRWEQDLPASQVLR